MSVWPYINPDIRYVGVSYLRQLNQVLKKESGEELAVLVPWETFLALQDAAVPRAAGGQRELQELIRLMEKQHGRRLWSFEAILSYCKERLAILAAAEPQV